MRGDEVEIDFAGTAPQARAAINTPGDVHPRGLLSGRAGGDDDPISVVTGAAGGRRAGREARRGPDAPGVIDTTGSE